MTTPDEVNAQHPVDYVHGQAELGPLLQGADHYDCKTIDSAVTMRQFLAGLVNYNPAWMRFLFRVRWAFVRVLGMKQEGIPGSLGLQAADVPFTPGEQVGFFVVTAAEEDRYWAANAAERHLSAYLVVVAQPLPGDRRRYHVATIVHYRHWTGPVYFNVIRPFHHIVVDAMMRYAAQPPGA